MLCSTASQFLCEKQMKNVIAVNGSHDNTIVLLIWNNLSPSNMLKGTNEAKNGILRHKINKILKTILKNELT